MDESIVREKASEIARHLGNCKKFLVQGNIYSCLLSFRDVLEKTLITRMLPADEKDLKEGINDFQRQLMASVTFRNTFGPITFQDDDIPTTLEFVKQLVTVSEESLAKDVDLDSVAPENRAMVIMGLIDRNEIKKARALIGGNEDLLTFIIQAYNAAGVEARKEKDFDKASRELKKALAVAPDDEGLMYNLARVEIEQVAWKAAEELIRQALKLNPAFSEAQSLLKYILARQKAAA